MLTISVTELIEICSYALGKKQAEDLGKHYAKYHDFIRIKDLIIQEFIRKNSEFAVCQRQRRELYRKLEDQKQGNLL